MAKIWVTKYALSTGVFCVEAEIDDEHGAASFAHDGYRAVVLGEGREWHRTEASAKARVEDLRRKKIASLKKQIAKLEAM